MSASQGKGKMVVISGPSGVGKTTLVRALLTRMGPRLVPSISATTRPPRPGEQQGKDYFFLSPEEFSACREAGGFLECFEVFGRGYWYGTLFSQVRPQLDAGKNVLLEVDVHGAMAVKRKFPEAILVFICPESMDELERRLRHRATDSEAAILRRLEEARSEMSHGTEYDYLVVNDSLERALNELYDVLNQCGV